TSQATWFDHQGKSMGTVGPQSPDRNMVLNPEGKRAAGRDATENFPGDVWLLDFARGLRTRLTFRQARGTSPIWSADGARIFFSAGNQAGSIYEGDLTGGGNDRELLNIPGGDKIPTSVSNDTRFLLYDSRTVPKTGSDLSVLPLQGDGKPVVL